MPDDQQIHVRVPKMLLEEMNVAQHALGLRSVAELVRVSVEEYLRKRHAEVSAYRKLRRRRVSTP